MTVNCFFPLEAVMLPYGTMKLPLRDGVLNKFQFRRLWAMFLNYMVFSKILPYTFGATKDNNNRLYVMGVS